MTDMAHHPPNPDTKDWTWVLDRPCPDCGFENIEGIDACEQCQQPLTNLVWITSLVSIAVTAYFVVDALRFEMAQELVHEMEAAQGYRRLLRLANHPVLTHILNAVIREESAHNQFYWSVARLELKKNEFAQKLARFVVEKFWAPVGQGSLARNRTEYVIGVLFNDKDAMDVVDKTVTMRVRQLPGFDDITKMTDTIGRIAETSSARLRIA